MKVKQALILLTIYLVFFVILNLTGLFINIIPYLFTLSPFLIMITGYIVLKERRFAYPCLRKDEELGYRDKHKVELDIF